MQEIFSNIFTPLGQFDPNLYIKVTEHIEANEIYLVFSIFLLHKN